MLDRLHNIVDHQYSRQERGITSPVGPTRWKEQGEDLSITELILFEEIKKVRYFIFSDIALAAKQLPEQALLIQGHRHHESSGLGHSGHLGHRLVCGVQILKDTYRDRDVEKVLVEADVLTIIMEYLSIPNRPGQRAHLVRDIYSVDVIAVQEGLHKKAIPAADIEDGFSLLACNLLQHDALRNSEASMGKMVIGQGAASQRFGPAIEMILPAVQICIDLALAFVHRRTSRSRVVRRLTGAEARQPSRRATGSYDRGFRAVSDP